MKNPSPPIDVSLVIKPAKGGSEVTQLITDASGGFGLTLDPGKYSLFALEILAPSMSDAAFRLPTNGPTFTVPVTGCAYIGRIAFSFVRMPKSSSPALAAAAIGPVAKKLGYRPGDAYFTFLASGSLILPAYRAGTTLPQKSDRAAGSENCSVMLAKF